MKMKSTLMKGIFFFSFMLLIAAPAFSQKPASKAEIKISTSAQCGSCKERIEKAMAYEKGVKKSDLDLQTKVLTVVFDPRKTNPEKIRLAVSKTGYDADDVAADPLAYKALPGCCKKPDDPDHIAH